MIYTFSAFLNLGKCVLIDNNKRTKKLLVELQNALQKHNLQLTDYHKNRIEFYTIQSAITNLWFGTLRGKKPTATEVQNALYLGAFTPIMDDLMDHEIVPFEELIARQNMYSADAVLFHYLHEKLLPLLSANKTFSRYFTEAHRAQNLSLKQLQTEPLSLAEIEKISQQKGGYYTLLYRAVLQNPLQSLEEACIYKLGGILQFANDLFDMHKDFQNGVQTLTTANPDIHYLRKKLEQYMAAFGREFWQMPYREANKKRAFASIMAIVTRAHVALNYYQNLQGNEPKISIEKYGRKPLIVDMDKPINLWLNLKIANQEHRLRTKQNV